jgi:hypothetical protein
MKKNILIIILIILVLALGLLLFKNNFVKKQEVKNFQENTSTNTADIPPLETWKTVNFSTLSIKYPPNWEAHFFNNIEIIVSDIPMDYTDGAGISNENMFIGGTFKPEDCIDGVLTQRNGTSVIGNSKCAVVNGVPVYTTSKNPLFLKTFDSIVQNIK